ncbi:ubiquitin-like small modifier protein 1 [Halococcus saccharolyticus]|uniref:Molybdopterin converting factor, small subunit 1 n=1 Tax=Halococcus saccharolyticus DSM 5350 TaxID=1227455 RepID=M0MKG1_9EURY|nr:ubiquitin-like small modifier protein 1 [Halococcus saccharolyticus]EMA46141.1 molybdopterin converting factor, small subunit 1 [Halococcus saccharolyticus DSM 5350]
MHWKLFATLAEAAGEREVDVEVEPDANLGDALAALFDRYPALEDEIIEDGEIRDHIRLLRNGEDPFVAGDGLDTALDEGDELAAFPPVSGG